MKFKITILYLFLLLVGCTSYKNINVEKLKGKYVWKGIYGVGESFEIKSDSTFTFSRAQGLIGGETKGKISSKNGYLHLFSELKKDTIPFDIEIPNQQLQDFYEIKVVDQKSNPCHHANCSFYIDNKLIGWKTTNKLGLIRVDSKDINLIKFQFVGYQKANLKINKNTPKSLIIKLKEETFYHYFDGQKIVKINNNKIKVKTHNSYKVFKRK